MCEKLLGDGVWVRGRRGGKDGVIHFLLPISEGGQNSDKTLKGGRQVGDEAGARGS